MRILTGDNLEILERLAVAGERFDLVELDGPYMAGLEAGWDDLTEEQYLQHYKSRLTLVRDVLQPWGSVYMFGYPEGVADVKAWAHESSTLHLRRWLTWYKQMTAHKGRKVEAILFFTKGDGNKESLALFGQMLKRKRSEVGWTLADVADVAGQYGYDRPWWHRGGNLYFETGSGGAPSLDDLACLALIFDFDADEWAHVTRGSYEGITDLDFLSRVYLEDSETLNDNGLRSKPIGLYTDLFRPVKPEGIKHPRALILYGGSGNAGIAAEALGYDVTLCELSPIRAERIEKRTAKLLPKWQARARAFQPQLTAAQPQQLGLLGG